MSKACSSVHKFQYVLTLHHPHSLRFVVDQNDVDNVVVVRKQMLVVVDAVVVDVVVEVDIDYTLMAFPVVRRCIVDVLDIDTMVVDWDNWTGSHGTDADRVVAVVVADVVVVAVAAVVVDDGVVVVVAV